MKYIPVEGAGGAPRPAPPNPGPVSLWRQILARWRHPKRTGAPDAPDAGMGFRATLGYLAKKSLAYLLVYIVMGYLACWLFSTRSLGDVLSLLFSPYPNMYLLTAALVGLIAVLPVLLLLFVFHAWRVLPDVVLVIAYAYLLLQLYRGENMTEPRGTAAWLAFAAAVIVCVPLVAFAVRWIARRFAGERTARLEAGKDLRASVKSMLAVSACVLALSAGLCRVQGYPYTNFDVRVDGDRKLATPEHPDRIAKGWLLAASQGVDRLDHQLDERFAKDEPEHARDGKTWREMEDTIFTKPAGGNYRLVRAEHVSTQPADQRRFENSAKLKGAASPMWHYIRMDVTYEDLSVPEAERTQETVRLVGLRTEDMHGGWKICPFGVIATSEVEEQEYNKAAIQLDTTRAMGGRTFDGDTIVFLKEYTPEKTFLPESYKGDYELQKDGHGPVITLWECKDNGRENVPVSLETNLKDPVFVKSGEPVRFYFRVPKKDAYYAPAIRIEEVDRYNVFGKKMTPESDPFYNKGENVRIFEGKSLPTTGPYWLKLL